jgi:hypothetical protein
MTAGPAPAKLAKSANILGFVGGLGEGVRCRAPS